jgi:hypothetical protein
MKTSAILISLSAIALAAALPKPQASTATIQFSKNGEAVKQIKVAVGAVSDKIIRGPDTAEIVKVTGAQNVVCTFNKNGGSTVAGEASVDAPAVFDEKVKTITRTECEFADTEGQQGTFSWV